MLPSSSEVARSLRGAWRVMQEGEKAFAAFDLTDRGLARSFGAILLTLPAVVALLAAERLRHGLSNEAGLLESPGLAASVVAMHLMPFVLAPALVIVLFWRVARTWRGTSFLIAWNWSEVIVALILAAPAALYAAGFVPGNVAALMAMAFAVIVLRLRYVVARSGLGLAGPTAAAVVLLVVSVEAAAAWTIVTLRG